MSILWNGNAPSNIIWSLGMEYVERNVGPVNTWTIPSTTTDCVSYSDTNTISLYGKGGHYETCYKAFTVDKSGTYTISYDYNLPNINFYGNSDSNYMHFGIYITTTQPPGGNMSSYASYTAGNCNGTDICGPSSQYNTPGTGSVSFNYNLTAGTTYYLWVPMMNLADGVQTYLTFTNLNVKSVNQYANTIEPELWFNGSKVWPIIAPSQLLYSNLTENSSYSTTINYNVDISSYDYILVKFDEKATVSGGAGGLHLVFNGSSSNQWDLRCHWAWSSYHAIRQTNSTGFTKVNNTVDLNTRDGGYLYYWKSAPSSSTYATHALLIDRNNNTCKHYLNGTYTGYGPLNAGTTLVKLTKNREQSSTYYNKNLYVYGGISEAVLQQYI